MVQEGFPGGSDGQESACIAGDLGLIFPGIEPAPPAVQVGSLLPHHRGRPIYVKQHILCAYVHI